jgi:hypothetical protein
MKSIRHQTTEHELIGGVLTAVIALAEKLTGERLTVYAQTEAGTVPICSRTKWSNPPAGEARSRSRHNVTPTEDAINWARLGRYQIDDPSPARLCG